MVLFMSGNKTRGGKRNIGMKRAIHFLLSFNLFLVLFLDVCISSASQASSKLSTPSVNDNEFAEFEEFDEDEVPGVGIPKSDGAAGMNRNGAKPGSQSSSSAEKTSSVPAASSSSNQEDEDSFVTEEEDDDEDDIFENIADPKDSDKKNGKSDKSGPSSSTGPKGELKFTRVPMHLRNNWDAYYMEILMSLGIIVYFINFMTGRSKNQRFADLWYETNRELLESNFSLVGDDGKKEIDNHSPIKETENLFILWCSGRVAVEGMLIELRFWKRHDLVSVISKMMKPVNDQIIIKVNLNQDAMDNFVFCISSKKAAVRLSKEMTDLATFCPDKKSVEKFGLNPDKLTMMNEVGEVAAVLLDTKVISILNKFENFIDYIHISDQYTGPKNMDETVNYLKLPETKKIIIFAFNLSTPKEGMSGESIEEQKPLMQFVFYMIDKIKRFRLTKEGKFKSEKNRQKVEESFLKATHAQRQEAAQAKREEKRRMEKEKILNEEDPEKQRKWEEKEYKREMKRKTPKMKQLKVKAM